MNVLMVHNLVEANGKTIRENNLDRQHQIPLESLVEVTFDQWLGDGACLKVHARLWTVQHTRDVDGTPLYTLGARPTFQESSDLAMIYTGFNESSLTVIPVTDEVRQGYGALEWPDEERHGTNNREPRNENADLH